MTTHPDSTKARASATIPRRALLAGVTLGAAALLQACRSPVQPTLAPTAVQTEPPTTATAVAPATATLVPEPSPSPTIEATSTSTPTPTPRTVTWWTGPSSTTWLAGIHATSDLYTSAHPEVTLRVSGGHLDFGRILAALLSGQAPDVLDVGSLIPFAARGIIAPLQSRIDSGSLVYSNFYPPMWANATWRGQVFGVPALDHGPELGLIWNVALANGQMPGASPTLSLPDVFRIGRTLTTHDGSGSIATLGFDPLDGEGGLLDTTRDLTGQAWIDLGFNKITLANPAYEAYLTGVQSYYNDLGLDQMSRFRQDVPPLTDSRDSGENRGRQVAIISGYWSVSDVAALEQNPSWDFQATWAPADPTASQVQRVGGRLVVLPNASREPDGGWDLIEFLVSDEGNAAMFNPSGRFVATRTFVESKHWMRWPSLQFFIASLGSATHLTSRSTSSVTSFAEVKWEQAWNDVLTGNRTPADALAAAQIATQAAFAEVGA